MGNLYKNNIKNDISEDEMVDKIKESIDEINGLGVSIKKLLKHCRVQFFLGLLFLFTLTNGMWAIGTACLWILTFLIASYKYNSRKNLILWYWMSIQHFKSTGLLTTENEYRIKDFTYNPLPFE